MKTRLLTHDVWERLSVLSARPRKKYVAVPFLGRNARRHLKLRRGDVLVVKFDLGTIKSGATDPREILYFVSKGVEVHSVENLHAKVFVFGRTAIVGSTNISLSSARTLIEAGIETTDTQVVQKARDFVLSLRGDIVEPQHARLMVKHYRSPRVSKRNLKHPPRIRQSVLWAVPLVSEAWEEEDYRQEKYAKVEAKKHLRKRRIFSIEDFLWYGGRFLDRVAREQRVLMCTDEGKKTMVTPPGRVIAVRRYQHKRGRRAIVCLAVRRTLHRKELKRFIKALGNQGKVFKKLSSPRKIRDSLLSFKIGAVWPKSGLDE